jgi:hypothetical protein
MRHVGLAMVIVLAACSGQPGGQCDGTACGVDCCAAGAICVRDSTGNTSCAEACDTSSTCPASAPCCAPISSGGGACAANHAGQACMCTTGAECSSGACAPESEAALVPYVCKANDGAPYDGCGLFCGGTSCCVRDAAGNKFCAEPCSSPSECTAGASCNSYDFSNSTCSGSTACGP